MIVGHGKDSLGKILDELVRYTERHFKYEEAMLRQIGYSKLAAHQAEHKKLTGEVVELREKYHRNTLTITMEVMTFLKNWLAGHIMAHDQQYAAELKNK
jgi:hemerythrin